LTNQTGLIYIRRMTGASNTHDLSPPNFLRLVGHPLRWHLLAELAQSDRQVRELTAALGRPQNLVSYHLGRLRRSGIVSASRSAADGRDTYYHLELARYRDLLAASGSALHRGIRLAPAPTAPPPNAAPLRVLFLCTGNSGRSQIAQALIEQAAPGTVVAASAGSHPKPLHPHAVAVMRARGSDISARRSKHLDELAGQRFDVVVTLCDRLREICPTFPDHPGLIHWSIADPSRIGDTTEETFAAFEATLAELDSRIGFLLSALQPMSEAA
jgi:protein-tyrosine-phosphatase/DNA-binding transcriptional ArsR family regulator